ncbi:MAG: hypothetical protein U0894_16325 [Pirellulales bacterium]
MKIEAFTAVLLIDFTKPEEGLGYDRFGGKKKMKYRNGTKFDEIAVLAGGYSSVDQPELEKMLKTIKYYKSEAIDPTKNKESNQQLARLRSAYRSINPLDAKKTKGPLGSAFVTRNPLLPEEYFAPKGLDPFVVELNKDSSNIASSITRGSIRFEGIFRGVDTMKPNEFEELTNWSQWGHGQARSSCLEGIEDDQGSSRTRGRSLRVPRSDRKHRNHRLVQFCW